MIRTKKQLPVAILALVVVLCSVSTASAWVSVIITPDEQYTCPQISNYWSPTSSPLLADKTVTYVVTVETDCPPVSVVIMPEDAPASWFSWLTLIVPTTAWTEPLDINVPLTLGTDAGGAYTFVVTAVDSCGGSAQTTADLIVQDHDYVSETLVQMEPGNTALFNINEHLRDSAAVAKTDTDINFYGTMEYFERNEYLMENARGNNANYEKEEAAFDLTNGYLYGDDRFKSCSVFGGTGVTTQVSYDFTWLGQRVENLNHHVSGNQRLKTEYSTYNEFNGTFIVNSKQLLPCSRRVVDYQGFSGNLTAGKHLIYRREPWP